MNGVELVQTMVRQLLHGGHLQYADPALTDGWVYTTDAWQDPAPYPEPGKVTRRRRWIRRVYYAGEQQGP